MDDFLAAECYAIRGAAFDVYKHLRNGYLEDVYQEAMELELADRGIPFSARPKVEIRYKNRILRQFYMPDFVCFGTVIVELKSAEALNRHHAAQTLNYMKATGLPVGLLVNFGKPDGIEIKRFRL